jgi:hypothetical protein
LVVDGTNSAVRQIIIPANQEKLYVIRNNTSGGYAITIGAATGATITIPNGVTAQVYYDGTDCFSSQTGSAGNFTVNGTLTATGLTYTGNMSVCGTLSVTGTTTFTGIPSGPTAAVGTNTTQLATTAFVTAASSLFAAGTVLLFYQAAAPTGWTQVTTQNNKALRVVSGTGGGTGGTTAFSTVFTDQTPTITTSGLSAGATTLTTAQMPAHTHTYNAGGLDSRGYGCAFPNSSAPSTQNTGSQGGGGSHTHTISGSATSSAITLAVQYIDIILASKN